MAGLTDILRTARDALAAQSYGLTVTGQNVANVNTEGYVRRRALLQPQPLGNQDFGTVQIKGLQRLSDQYTEQRHYAALGLSASASESDRLLGQLEGVFELTSGTGIGQALGQLFSSFSRLTADPSDLSVRAQILQQADNFASTLNSAAATLSSFKAELPAEAKAITQEVSGLTSDLAKLNAQITNAENSGHDAADLKDERDRQILKLSTLVDIRTFTNNKGLLVIQGAGTTLVEGEVARKLDIGLASNGTLQVLSVNSSGATADVSRFLTGGRLAAIRDLHDVHATELMDRLDTFAFDVASEINSVHASGYNLDGGSGVVLFDVAAGPASAARNLRLDSTIQGQPRMVAAAALSPATPGDGGNALALAQLADSRFAAGGTRTPAEAYGDLIADVGTRKARASQDATMRESMTAQVYTMRESASGVNLDEEMISLTKFQRAFEAASRVLNTADELLERLINTLGR
ncbi:MAG: hypothetical protein RJA70_3600 [Pseudomonadota bacterium]